MSDECPHCGDNRHAVDTGYGWVDWHCATCPATTRETVVEPLVWEGDQT